jgi:hypothetical protein
VQGGFNAPYARKKPGTTQRTHMTTLEVDNDEFGAKNVKYYEYS